MHFCNKKPKASPQKAFYCLTPNGVRVFSGVLFPKNILLLRSKTEQKELTLMHKIQLLDKPKSALA